MTDTMSTRAGGLVRAAFFCTTLALPLLYFGVLNPIFAKPNTFEDGLGYLDSAKRLLETGSPYQDWQLAGPYNAVTPADTFRYPPPFAQVAAVFALTGARWLFLAILVATCFLAPLVMARNRREGVLALWLGLAFLPDYWAAWEGQVTGLLSLTVAFALLDSPAAIWIGAALKVTPALAVPAAIRGMPRATVIAAVVLLPALAISIAVSPVAWTQFPAVLVNQFLGGTYPSLAPAGFARYVALVVAGIALLGSVVMARRHWPLALYLAVVAGLLLPGFLPKYYVPVVLPFLFVGLRDPRARWWSLLAFLPLDLPLTNFPGPFFVGLGFFAGLGLLGISMWRLEGNAADGLAASNDPSTTGWRRPLAGLESVVSRLRRG